MQFRCRVSDAVASLRDMVGSSRGRAAGCREVADVFSRSLRTFPGDGRVEGSGQRKS